MSYQESGIPDVHIEREMKQFCFFNRVQRVRSKRLQDNKDRVVGTGRAWHWNENQQMYARRSFFDYRRWGEIPLIIVSK